MDSEVATITISPERLKQLEAAEAKLKKQEEKTREKLKRLNEVKREDTEYQKQRALKHYYRNKDTINERRRAAYKAKKEAEAAAQAGPGNLPATVQPAGC